MSRIISLFFLLTALRVSGQNFKEDFTKLFSSQDTTAQITLLQKWKTAKPNDAEVYIAFFNYYVKKSQREVVSLEGKQKSNSSFELTDSSGKTAGFLSSHLKYDQLILEEGFKYIDQGISSHPDRLDMRFGKIYMYGQSEDFSKFTMEIINTIHYSAKNGNKWLWANNKSLEDPKKFMLKNIQTYVIQLYNIGDEQADNMKSIAETVLQHYPDHVESMSNIAIACSIKGDNENALKYLLQATKFAPHDFIVLNNIAHIYDKKGDKRNAIKYYELTLKYGDEEARQLSVEKLKELKK